VTILATAPNPGFEAPGAADFDLPPIFGEVTKPVLQFVLAAILVWAFFRDQRAPPAAGAEQGAVRRRVVPRDRPETRSPGTTSGPSS
jgi:F-type H+-transporting ATPase subunit a